MSRKRYVFKFFGSIGPGGSWASIVEQVCTNSYPAAYNIGDEEQIESSIDKQIKELRQEFVNEMFEIKDEFQEKIEGDQDSKDEAYKQLIELLKKYIEKTVRMEKNKYMRERVFYQRCGEVAMYERANKSYNNVRREVEDNITKQAKIVFKPSPEDFDNYFSELYAGAGDDLNEEEISERISEYEARKFYEMWIKIQGQFQQEKQRLSQLRAKGGATPEDQAKMSKILDVSAEELVEQQKDLLFIESGEDVEDLFVAFKFYKLE